MLCNMMPWQSSHVARRCLAPSVYSNSMTAWLNGFWEHGRQPGVIYRHDLIEWNTIHPESVLRTIFLDVTMSGNARRTPIWVMTRKVRSAQRAVYLGTYSKGVKKNYSDCMQLSKCSHTTNLFTHFSGSGNIGLLFWLHPSTGNNPLVRMSTTTHKQHLGRITTVLVWHPCAISWHVYIH